MLFRLERWPGYRVALTDGRTMSHPGAITVRPGDGQLVVLGCDEIVLGVYRDGTWAHAHTANSARRTALTYAANQGSLRAQRRLARLDRFAQRQKMETAACALPGANGEGSE